MLLKSDLDVYRTHLYTAWQSLFSATVTPLAKTVALALVTLDNSVQVELILMVHLHVSSILHLARVCFKKEKKICTHGQVRLM